MFGLGQIYSSLRWLIEEHVVQRGILQDIRIRLGDPERSVEKPAKFTDEERGILMLLHDARRAFSRLPWDRYPDDRDDFDWAINQAENLVAGRLAARVDPDGWWEKEDDHADPA